MTPERPAMQSWPNEALSDYLYGMLDQLQEDQQKLWVKGERLAKQLSRNYDKREKIGNQIDELMERIKNIQQL